jgi:hypothetical protein
MTLWWLIAAQMAVQTAGGALAPADATSAPTDAGPEKVRLAPAGATTLCPLVAQQLPLKPPSGNRKAWRLDTRGGMKGLFQGSVSTRFGARPVNPDDGKAWQLAMEMCEATDEGGECRLEGPVEFSIAFDDQQFGWELEADERMLIRVRGTIIECEEIARPAKKAAADVR